MRPWAIMTTLVLAAALTGCGMGSAEPGSGGTLTVQRAGELFYDEGVHGFVVVRDAGGAEVLAES